MKNILSASDAKSEVDTLVKRGYTVLISGEPGSGKDYISAKWMKNQANWCYLDSLGKDEEDRWIVKIPDAVAKTASIFVGICDNMEDVTTEIMKYCEGKFLLIYVMPDPVLFREANAAKAAESLQGGRPTRISSFFAKNGAMTNSQASKYLAKGYEHFAKKMGSLFAKLFPTGDGKPPVSFEIIVVENKKEGAIQGGWHKKPDTSDQKNAKDSKVEDEHAEERKG
jgi:hypothetical protein